MQHKITNSRLTAAIIGVFGLLLLAQWGTADGWITDWWALDQAGYTTLWLPLIALVIVLGVNLPPVSRFLQSHWRVRARVNSRGVTLLLRLGGALLGMGCFWMYRSATHFLGDGFIRARDLTAGVWITLEEPFDIIAHYLVYTWGRQH